MSQMTVRKSHLKFIIYSSDIDREYMFSKKLSVAYFEYENLRI